jgi:hypothetical protein
MTEASYIDRAPQSQFQRLVDVLLREGGYVVALWEAYFDESGDDGRTTEFVVGGYIMTSARAKTMDAGWRDMLRRYGIEAFHMVDCAHGSEEFAGWPKECRISIAAEAIALINLFTSDGVCFLTNSTKMKIPHDLYSLCSANILMSIAQYVESKEKDGRVSLFFESGHSSQKTAKAEFDNVIENFSNEVLRNSTVTFAPKKRTPLLQAADLLCWHV